MIETEVSTIVALSSAARNSVLWLVTALKGARQEVASDVWLVDLPPEGLDGQADFQRLLLTAPTLDGAPPLAFDHPWLQRLLQLAHEQGPLQARPRQQPQQWHEIENRLLAPYEIDGGEKIVAGCTLEERPLLRLSLGRVSPLGMLEIENVFCDETGTILSKQLVEQLCLDDLELQEQPPVRRLGHDWLLDWVTRSVEHLETEDGSYQLMVATVIWCKYAEGKIALTLNGRRADAHFRGWAQLYVSGILQPPPFSCPTTGISSYHIAATDGGVLTAAEAIATCQHSGVRVLCNELRTCADTGAQVVGRYLEQCPVTNQPAVPAALDQCTCCRQRVRRMVLQLGVCLACRSLGVVRKNDPRLARLLGHYPKLDRWRRWKLAETGTSYILVAESFFKRLLLVVQKSDLEPVRMAIGKRRRGWTDVSDEDQSQWLGDN